MVPTLIMQCVFLSVAVTPPNAADSWNDFFEQVQEMDLPSSEQTSWGPVEQSRYEELLPLIQQARQIARMEHCDWGLDYSQGLGMLLPHLSPMRRSALLINYSVHADVAAGNEASAIDGMNSLLGISRQMRADKTVIGSLVSYSAFTMIKQLITVVDSSNDVSELASFQQSLHELDPFDPIALRASVGHERDLLMNWFESPEFKELDPDEFGLDIDASTWDLDVEIENYDKAMDRAVEIFAIEDETLALAEYKLWAEALEAGEYGEMPRVLCPALGRLMETAFDASEDVAYLKEVVDKKMQMLQAPNAATYFLEAVEAYAAIDQDARLKATQQRDFGVLDTPLQLLAKAAAMDPVRMTLANDPATPQWIAPLYALTMDGITRGTPHDLLVSLQVAGHMSLQDRFAASIAAANIYTFAWKSPPDKHCAEYELCLDAIRRIPHADAFMLHASAQSDTLRLAEWFEVEGSWKPSKDMVLASTITLANEYGVAELWPTVWSEFVDSLGVPDDDSVVIAAIRTRMSDALVLAELDQSGSFHEKLRGFRSLFAGPR